MRHNCPRPACAALLGALLLAASAPGQNVPAAPAPRPAGTAAQPEKKPAQKDRPEAKKEAAPASLDRLAGEWLARKGAVELAHRRFQAQAQELKAARQRLAAVSEPAAKAVPPTARADDVDAAIKAAEQLTEYHAALAQKLDEVAAAAATLLVRGEDFDRAAKEWSKQRDATAAAARAAGQVPDAISARQLAADAERLKSLAVEVSAERDRAKADLPGLEAAVKDEKAASASAAAKLDELKAGREATLAAFAFEERVRGMKAEPLVEEFGQLRRLLAEKLGAIKGDAGDYAKAASAAAEARAKLAGVKGPPVAPPEVPGASLPPLERAARSLFAAQQQYAAQLRAMEEREEKTRALVAALDELEKKAVAYSSTLDGVRQTAGQVAAVAAEIERRVGRGELDAGKVPEGVAQATGAAGGQARLEADAAGVRDALAKLRQERGALRKPDAQEENVKSLTTGLHARVGERIDLLAELKRLAADYATARKDRSESERRRADQRAGERLAREGKPWDPLLALDRSERAAALSALLGAYYRELGDLDEAEESLRKQKEALGKLIDLAQREEGDVAKLRAVLEKRPSQSEAARKWDDWLAARLGESGVRAEVGVYREEQARLDAVGGVNARRVEGLTGQPPVTGGRQAEQPATGGEIGRARAELLEARARGLIITGIKVALVLLAALILPRLVVFALRRAIRGGTDDAGNPSPALAALRGALRLGVWVAALALILSVLGYDVTALVVALAIGALAVALAARPMIADVLGSLVIFAERRFKVGDVVRLAGGEPARVTEITWRSTTLKNASGLVLSVPNRTVTEAAVENQSRGGETYDALSVTINTDKDAARVIHVIRSAMAQCKNLSADQGVAVVSYTQRGAVKVVQYRFWWFLKDYETRNKTRDEVIARVALGLAHEDMTGIEITMA